MLTPHGPASMECDATYPPFIFESGIYPANKHNYFNEIDCRVVRQCNNIENVYIFF